MMHGGWEEQRNREAVTGGWRIMQANQRQRRSGGVGVNDTDWLGGGCNKAPGAKQDRVDARG